MFGCHHAREWVAVEVPYRLAEHLVDNASADPVRSWLQQGEVWVAPMVNPDGHEHTRTRDRPWRKNCRRNADGSTGVDPNRNDGYMWGTFGAATSSHVPSDETHVGPRAYSEPEVRPVRDLVARELVGGVLTYHNYSQLILYPWGTRPTRFRTTPTCSRCAGWPRRCSGSSRACTGAPTSRSRRRSSIRPRATSRTGPTGSTTCRRSRSSYVRPWRGYLSRRQRYRSSTQRDGLPHRTLSGAPHPAYRPAGGRCSEKSAKDLGGHAHTVRHGSTG